MIKTVSIAALIAATATASFAGSFGDAVVEAPAQNDAIIAPTGSGIGLPLVIGGIAAVAVIAAVVANNDDDDEATGTTEGSN